MKQFKQTMARLSRFRLRSSSLRLLAIIFGLLCLLLLLIALYKGHFLEADSYITGFKVRQIEDAGDSVTLCGADNRRLILSRREMGSDSYFRIKGAVAQGSYVRAMVHNNIIEEVQLDGRRIYRMEESDGLAMSVSFWMLGFSAFCLLVCFVFISALILRKRRRRRRIHKK